jgi:hypothetical protein
LRRSLASPAKRCARGRRRAPPQECGAGGGCGYVPCGRVRTGTRLTPPQEWRGVRVTSLRRYAQRTLGRTRSGEVARSGGRPLLAVPFAARAYAVRGGEVARYTGPAMNSR